MSKGGFEANVRIVRAEIGGGLGDNGMPLIRAEMELEGTLLAFNYDDLREQISDGAKSFVSCEIEFTDNYEAPLDCYDADKDYIGTIRIFYPEKNEMTSFNYDIHAIVRINLPMRIYTQLCFHGDENFTLETIHDIIKNPTKHQTTDHIVALVKRVYFSIAYDPPVNKKKKSKWW